MTKVDQGGWTSLNTLELQNELALKKKGIQAIPYIWLVWETRGKELRQLVIHSLHASLSHG